MRVRRCVDRSRLTRVSAAAAAAAPVQVKAPNVPLAEREIFGRLSLTLELTSHAVTGVKVRSSRSPRSSRRSLTRAQAVEGMHLVATFQNPGDATPLIVEHTLTAADIAASGKQRVAPKDDPAKERKSSSTLVLVTPGLFGVAKARHYAVDVSVFADATCQSLVATHHQLIYCAVDTTVVDTYAKIDALPKNKRTAVQRDLGFAERESIERARVCLSLLTHRRRRARSAFEQRLSD